MSSYDFQKKKDQKSLSEPGNSLRIRYGCDRNPGVIAMGVFYGCDYVFGFDRNLLKVFPGRSVVDLRWIDKVDHSLCDDEKV